MKYKLLSKEAEPNLDDNVENGPTTQESIYQDGTSGGYLRKPRWRLVHFGLLLLQLMLITVWIASSWVSKQTVVNMQYGRDFDYMSLDHKFDDLWGGVEVEDAGVIQLKDHDGR